MKLLSFIQRYISLIAIACLGAFLVLLNFRQLPDTIFPNDIISWVLPASATLRGLGVPYVDYWDIKPPGLLLMTTLWAVGGTSLAWFHVLNMIVLFGIGWMYWRTLNFAFRWYESFLLFGFSLFVFLSMTIHSQIMPSEINGLFFSFLGLTVLLSKWPTGKKAFWTACMFALAGQMKEVFTFSILAMAPYYVHLFLRSKKETTQALLAGLGGVVTVALLLVGYLGAIGSLGAYREVLMAKSKAFGVTSIESITQTINYYRAIQFPRYRFIRLNYQLPVAGLLAVAGAALHLTLQKKMQLKKASKNALLIQVQIRTGWLPSAILFFYWLGMYLGYGMQNRFGAPYDLAVLLSTFIVVGLIAKVLAASLIAVFTHFFKKSAWVSRPGWKVFVTLVLLIALTAPHKMYVIEAWDLASSWRPSIHRWRWTHLEEPSMLETYATIQNRTNPEDCIQAVYGWASGRVYLYSQRQPCARHFIPNIITPNYIEEYRQSLIDGAPKIIFYTLAGADLTIPDFEKNVFPYAVVLENCYTQDSTYAEIYWAGEKYADKSELSACIQDTLALPIPSE